jgi:hypothetical protein
MAAPNKLINEMRNRGYDPEVYLTQLIIKHETASEITKALKSDGFPLYKTGLYYNLNLHGFVLRWIPEELWEEFVNDFQTRHNSDS